MIITDAVIAAFRDQTRPFIAPNDETLRKAIAAAVAVLGPRTADTIPLGWTLINDRHLNTLVEGLAEIHATTYGHSDQPIKNIIEGVLAEIMGCPSPIQGVGPPL